MFDYVVGVDVGVVILVECCEIGIFLDWYENEFLDIV